MDEGLIKRPRCVASTQQDASGGFFQSAQWSPDGTCIITNSERNEFRTYIVPPDLLDARDEPHVLLPYTTHASPEPVYAWTPHPAFAISDLRTTLALSSPLDHPIRLTNVLSPSRPDDDNDVTTLQQSNPVVATYPLIDPITESFLTPASLLFPPTSSRAPGSSFLAGAHSLLAIFDTERPGEEPINRVKTIPSVRKKIKGGGVGIKGIISALACSDATTSEGLVAAGTWTRNIGLYTADSALSQFAVWSLREDSWASPTSDTDRVTGVKADIGGAGVDKLAWSPCGRYLYVFERRSDGALLYDVRGLGKKLGTLIGRGARTNQRLGACVVDGETSSAFRRGRSDDAVGADGREREYNGQADGGGHHDIYTTSMTGTLNIYSNPHLKEGIIAPDSVVPNLHGDAVGGLSMHPSYGVLATAAGQRHGRWDQDEESDTGEDSGGDGSSGPKSSVRRWDQSMKIWAA